jgi:hypothetical protein
VEKRPHWFALMAPIERVLHLQLLADELAGDRSISGRKGLWQAKNEVAPGRSWVGVHSEGSTTFVPITHNLPAYAASCCSRADLANNAHRLVLVLGRNASGNVSAGSSNPGGAWAIRLDAITGRSLRRYSNARTATHSNGCVFSECAVRRMFCVGCGVEPVGVEVKARVNSAGCMSVGARRSALAEIASQDRCKSGGVAPAVSSSYATLRAALSG